MLKWSPGGFAEDTIRAQDPRKYFSVEWARNLWGSKNLRREGLVLDLPIGLIQQQHPIAEAIDSRLRGETHLVDAVLLESLIFRVTAGLDRNIS